MHLLLPKWMNKLKSLGREHAEMFAKILQTAEKRFAALTKVEKRHAQHY